MSPSLARLFTAHPDAVNETYAEHFGAAMGYARRMFVASVCAFVHALLPFLFEKTASTMVRGMVADMDRRTAPPARTPAMDSLASSAL